MTDEQILGANQSRLYRQRARKKWRTRALDATLLVSMWPTGAPGRDAAITAAVKAQNKVRAWFTPPRADCVLSAIHRRALNAFRQPKKES